MRAVLALLAVVAAIPSATVAKAVGWAPPQRVVQAGVGDAPEFSLLGGGNGAIVTRGDSHLQSLPLAVTGSSPPASTVLVPAGLSAVAVGDGPEAGAATVILLGRRPARALSAATLGLDGALSAPQQLSSPSARVIRRPALDHTGGVRLRR